MWSLIKRTYQNMNRKNKILIKHNRSLCCEESIAWLTNKLVINCNQHCFFCSTLAVNISSQTDRQTSQAQCTVEHSSISVACCSKMEQSQDHVRWDRHNILMPRWTRELSDERKERRKKSTSFEPLFSLTFFIVPLRERERKKETHTERRSKKAVEQKKKLFLFCSLLTECP